MASSSFCLRSAWFRHRLIASHFPVQADTTREPPSASALAAIFCHSDDQREEESVRPHTVLRLGQNNRAHYVDTAGRQAAMHASFRPRGQARCRQRVNAPVQQICRSEGVGQFRSDATLPAGKSCAPKSQPGSAAFQPGVDRHPEACEVIYAAGRIVAADRHARPGSAGRLSQPKSARSCVCPINSVALQTSPASSSGRPPPSPPQLAHNASAWGYRR